MCHLQQIKSPNGYLALMSVCCYFSSDFAFFSSGICPPFFALGLKKLFGH